MLREISSTKPPTKEGVERAKDQLKASLVFGVESSHKVMIALARYEIMLEEPFSLDNIIAQIDAVSYDDIVRVAGELFDHNCYSIGVIGNIEPEQVEEH